MNNICKIGICLLVCLFLVFPKLVRSQNKGKCKELVMSHFKAFQEAGFPTNKNAHHYVLSTYNVFSPEYEASSQKMNLDIVMAKDYSMYESSYVSMYKDTKETIVLVHPQKTLLIYSSEKDTFLNENFKRIGAFQDSVFVKMTENQCKVVDYEGKKVMQGIFIPTAGIKKRIGIAQIQTQIDLSTGKLLRMESFFEKPSKLTRQVVEYLEVDLKYKVKGPKIAKENVFGANGKLLAKYKNYEIIDQRKNK